MASCGDGRGAGSMAVPSFLSRGGSTAMMGIKERNFRPLPQNLSLENLVPRDNFYRCLEERLDLSFVKELVVEYYAAVGRPSIDPEVFFRLQLVMFFEGIRSERQLMEVAADRLSIRWYLGYDLHETLPDHSSLTRIRKRYGLEAFRGFFERIVEMCFEAGLVRGEELFFDSTKVKANADIDSLASRFLVETHLSRLFEEPSISEGSASETSAGTDLDATPMLMGEGEVKLGYQTHYVVDGGKARIILAALVTPYEVSENRPMLDLLWRSCFRWRIWPPHAPGDGKSGAAENITAIEQANIRAFVGLYRSGG